MLTRRSSPSASARATFEELRITHLPPEGGRRFDISWAEDVPESESMLVLNGRFSFREVVIFWTEIRARLAERPDRTEINFDMSRVTAIDGGTMALLVQLRAEIIARGAAAEFLGASGNVQQLIHVYKGDVDPRPRPRRRPQSMLTQIGRATLDFVDSVKLVFDFFGDMVLSALGLLREPFTGNWKEVTHLMERAGADAVPIVVLINFLVGFVMAFQGAVQLKQFGANIFVADLVGISIVRELGPLMTAIIACGRSGASFAAELGTMKVSEEIDALRTLGFGPMRFLVLPRAVALMLVMPVLTLLADTVGILGGLAVGVTSLDLTFEAYFLETRKALTMWSVGSGLIKSLVFGLAISLIACQQGFATSGGAEGVGRRTTSSVVSGLFALILLDAAFTVLFYMFKL